MSSKFRNKFHQEIQSPYTSQTYTIRRINIYEFVESLGILPLATASSVQEQMEKAFKELEDKSPEEKENLNQKGSEFFLKKGVIYPKIFFGDSDECPEDQIAFEDLGNDASFLVEQITAYSTQMSGFNNMDLFFSGERTDSPGPDRETV